LYQLEKVPIILLLLVRPHVTDEVNELLPLLHQNKKAITSITSSYTLSFFFTASLHPLEGRIIVLLLVRPHFTGKIHDSLSSVQDIKTNTSFYSPHTSFFFLQHYHLTQVILLLLARPQLANEVDESLFPPSPPYQDIKTISATHTSSFLLSTSSLNLKLTLSRCQPTELTSPLVPSSPCRHLSIGRRIRLRLPTVRFETLSLP
jgi:hypothetical protein